ncbi:MAG: FKBP-type peptidyl-prolyl cis-trans isomerase [bacterium]|nr:FKBP-type peptidyl-prolyl cis-trans isomerase [bacterium]
MSTNLNFNINIIGALVFIVVATALIGGGIYYNRKLDEKARSEALVEQEEINKAQAEIMEKLIKEDVVVGTGAEAKSGDTISVNYTGTFEDGKAFDSNVDPQFNHVTQFVFILGLGLVIQGWDLGVLGMKVGGKRKLTIPPELGYGASGVGPIPGGATLKFIVELLSVTPHALH